VDVYTIPEAAKLTGRTPRAIRLQIEDGALEAFEREGVRMVECSALERAGLFGGRPRVIPGDERPAPVELTVRELLERVERQAIELAERDEVEGRREDERRRLETALIGARQEIERQRERIAELEGRGMRTSVRHPVMRESLAPLFEAVQERE
jgi:ATP phosphoribosyltransferase regulatory subunit HisZ